MPAHLSTKRGKMNASPASVQSAGTSAYADPADAADMDVCAVACPASAYQAILDERGLADVSKVTLVEAGTVWTTVPQCMPIRR